MQISLENTSALERRLTITVPEEAIVDKVKSRLDELVRTVKVDVSIVVILASDIILYSDLGSLSPVE